MYKMSTLNIEFIEPELKIIILTCTCYILPKKLQRFLSISLSLSLSLSIALQSYVISKFITQYLCICVNACVNVISFII